ncbi:MAG: homoserine dehydrogenase [Porticoccaceae bacterium]|nr:homoserine dehydrogenase [Porticoccaceae bacterium]
MKTVNIGICGLGTVGSGTFNVLTRNTALIDARAGANIRIAQVAARRINPACDTAEVPMTTDIFAVVNNPDVDVVVELIGGTTVARDLVLEAIRNGKHVVTANKALIALHGNEIFEAARQKSVMVAFEAAVAGGIPIIKTLREGLGANRIEWLAGIINGTSNFILTAMEEQGSAFADALSEAQALGYAEADPTFDIEGIDAAHKLVILASLAFGIPLQFDKVYTQGITNLDLQDLAYARELGYRIKHLGIARETEKGVEVRVHPTLIPDNSLIAEVDGVMNAVMVKGDAVGPTLFYGAGAGAEPTASAVVADIIDVARALNSAPETRVPYLAFSNASFNGTPIIAIEEVETAYYLRMSALDRPGVLSKLASIMSDRGISIEAIIQKRPLPGEDHVRLIMLTNTALERDLVAAVEAIEALDAIAGPVVRIRVEALDK